MQTCTKCGSSNLKFLDRQVLRGVRMERYKCLDCGQIQMDDVRSRFKNAPKITPQSREHFWAGCIIGMVVVILLVIAMLIISPLLALRFG